MRVLIDTHAFLWWVDDDKRLSKRARKVIASGDCFLSMATAWELAIKVSLGKLALNRRASRFFEEEAVANRFAILGIQLRHLAELEQLPLRHGDPFDRLLIAQATTESLAMVSKDATFDAYEIQRVW